MKLLIKKKKNISELIIKKRDQLANYYKNYCFGQTKKQNLKILTIMFLQITKIL